MKKNIIHHPSLKFATEINDICRPLLNLNISYFCHVHISKDNQFSAISNHPTFTEHYINKKYFNADIHMAKALNLGNFVLWDELKCAGASKQMDIDGIEMGIKHAFTLIHHERDGSHYYHFANNQESKSINQTYLANLDLLNLFILHFKETLRTASHLREAYHFTYGLDENAANYLLSPSEDEFFRHHNRTNFLHQLQASPNLQRQILLPHMTGREHDCLRWLIAGKTAPEISIILNVSSRTVEKYLANLKQKFSCQTLCELGYKIGIIKKSSGEL